MRVLWVSFVGTGPCAEHVSLARRACAFLFHKDRATCRFFYPWPHQPYQCYCMNTERVALQRRLVEDDQWVVPHNLCIAMYSPSSVNVLPFDPQRGRACAHDGSGSANRALHGKWGVGAGER